MDFIELVEKLNEHLNEKNKFHLDLVHNSNPTSEKIPHIKYVGKAPSILHDHAIVPQHLLTKVYSNCINRGIVEWINRKIFTTILIDLLNDDLTSLKTRFVRLRIGGCMAVNVAILLTNEEKEEWRNQINQIFYERTKVINDYYLDEIIKLPF